MKELKKLFNESIQDLENEFDCLFDKYGFTAFFYNKQIEMKGYYWSLRKTNPDKLLKIGVLEKYENHYYWTDDFKREAFLYKYAYIITVVIEKLHKKVAQYSLYYSKEKLEIRKQLSSLLNRYLSKIQKNEHYLAYHLDDFRKANKDFYGTRFGNKLDVVYDLNLENDKFIEKLNKKIREKKNFPMQNVMPSYGNIVIDADMWISMELTSRMVHILKSFLDLEIILDNHLKKTHSNDIIIPYKIFPSQEVENQFRKILEHYGCFDKTGNTNRRFMPICDAFFSVHQHNKQYFRPLLEKGDYIDYLSKTFLKRKITKLSSGDKYIKIIANDFPQKKPTHN